MQGRSRWLRARAGIAIVIAAATSALVASIGCRGVAMTTATHALQQVERNDDPNLRYLAYAKLASPRIYEDDAQRAKAVQVLSEAMGPGKEPVATRAVICRTLGTLGDPRAREPLRRAVADPEAIVRAEACRALGKVGRPEDVSELARIMAADTVGDCRIAAIEGLGALKGADSRVAQVLVTGMEHADPAIRLASVEALRATTGRDYGLDPAAWRKAIPAETDRSIPIPPRR